MALAAVATLAVSAVAAPQTAEAAAAGLPQASRPD